MTVRRPLIRYHGGKWKLAPWILSHLPQHRCYVEPFGGGGSVLLRKLRSYAEVYNDLDGEVVGLFRVARDHGPVLREKLRLTPFARAEFLEAWYPSDDPIEQARRTVIRAFMGFGSAAVTLGRSAENPGRGGLAKTGFRANSNRSGTTPAHDWANYPDALDFIVARLQGVVIENKDARECMAQHDSSETVHYVDPPYLPETRDKGGDYAFEMTEQDHIELSQFLKTLKGSVLVSGYDSPLYKEIYSEWPSVRRDAFADGARKRVEVLWMNGETRQQAMAI